MPSARRWVAAGPALAAAAGALLWIEIAVWKALEPVPDKAQSQQVAAGLAEVSSALFSLHGEPIHVPAESLLPEFQQDDDATGACDGPAWPAAAGCDGVLVALEGASMPAPRPPPVPVVPAKQALEHRQRRGRLSPTRC